MQCDDDQVITTPVRDGWDAVKIERPLTRVCAIVASEHGRKSDMTCVLSARQAGGLSLQSPWSVFLSISLDLRGSKRRGKVHITPPEEMGQNGTATANE